MSDEPLTIEDEIAHDAYSNLILCMMKDADTAKRVAEIKADNLHLLSPPPPEFPKCPVMKGERRWQKRLVNCGIYCKAS